MVVVTAKHLRPATRPDMNVFMTIPFLTKCHMSPAGVASCAHSKTRIRPPPTTALSVSPGSTERMMRRFRESPQWTAILEAAVGVEPTNISFAD